MAQLIVRNLDDEVVRCLRIRAAEHGCSMEAEHRTILSTALGLADSEHQDFKAALLGMPAVGTDADFERDRDMGREVELPA